jgi:hypothetical protein
MKTGRGEETAPPIFPQEEFLLDCIASPFLDTVPYNVSMMVLAPLATDVSSSGLMKSHLSLLKGMAKLIGCIRM